MWYEASRSVRTPECSAKYDISPIFDFPPGLNIILLAGRGPVLHTAKTRPCPISVVQQFSIFHSKYL